MNSAQCHLCEQGKMVFQFSRNDYNLYMCNKCHILQVLPTPSQEELFEFYQTTNTPSHKDEKAINVSKASATRRIDTIIKLGGKGKLLDVGCGLGFTAQYALQFGFHVTAIDIEPASVEYATRLTGLKIETTMFEHLNASPESFDVINMDQVLEHMVNPVKSMEKAYSLLRPNGLLSVSVPNFDSYVQMLFRKKDPYIAPPTPKLFLPKIATHFVEALWI